MKEQKLFPGLTSDETVTGPDGVTTYAGVLLGTRRADGGFKTAPGTGKAKGCNDLFKFVDEKRIGIELERLLKPVADAFGSKVRANLKTGELKFSTPMTIQCGSSMVRLSTEVLATQLVNDLRLVAYVRMIGKLGMYVQIDTGMNMIKLWMVDLGEVEVENLIRCDLKGERNQFAKRIDNVRWVEVEI